MFGQSPATDIKGTKIAREKTTKEDSARVRRKSKQGNGHYDRDEDYVTTNNGSVVRAIKCRQGHSRRYPVAFEAIAFDICEGMVLRGHYTVGHQQSTCIECCP